MVKYYKQTWTLKDNEKKIYSLIDEECTKRNQQLGAKET